MITLYLGANMRSRIRPTTVKLAVGGPVEPVLEY